MVLPLLTFMVDLTMNVRGWSTILRAPGVPKNYSHFMMVFNGSDKFSNLSHIFSMSSSLSFSLSHA